MSGRTDTADAARDQRHLEKLHLVDELLESAQFQDLQLSGLHPAVIVNVQEDLGVSFNSGNGVYDDA